MTPYRAFLAIWALMLLAVVYLAVTDYPVEVTPTEDGPLVETSGLQWDADVIEAVPCPPLCGWEDDHGEHVAETDLGHLMGER